MSGTTARIAAFTFTATARNADSETGDDRAPWAGRPAGWVNVSTGEFAPRTEDHWCCEGCRRASAAGLGD